MKIKALLYCTKAKNKSESLMISCKGEFKLAKDFLYITDYPKIFNGKIVAECDYEVEKIKKVNYDCLLFTNTLDTEKLINKSCIGYFKLEKYLKPNWDKEDDLQNLDTVGYAIHIKNLHIFDKPKELKECHKKYGGKDYSPTYYIPIAKAPQNMMKVWLYENGEWIMYILISIQSQWMCKILNKEKDIEVRKKVLEVMLENV